jgi:hypothetical protein
MAAILSDISQNIQRIRMACLLLFFGTNWGLPFVRRGAILTGGRRGKKWVYIAAGLMDGGRWKSQRGVGRTTRVVGDECARVLA